MDNNTIDTSPVVQAFSDWLSAFKDCFSDFQTSIAYRVFRDVSGRSWN